MNSMKYKGYHAKIEYDPDDHIFVGRIIGLRDVVGFHGESVQELETAFAEAVTTVPPANSWGRSQINRTPGTLC